MDALFLLNRSTFYPLYTHLLSGLLEAPSLPPQLNIETVSYKIFLAGKPAVGKTSTVAKLLGQGELSTYIYVAVKFLFQVIFVFPLFQIH